MVLQYMTEVSIFPATGPVRRVTNVTLLLSAKPSIQLSASLRKFASSREKSGRGQDLGQLCG